MQRTSGRVWLVASAALAAVAVLTLAGNAHAESFDTKETIFVSVASYRDSDCIETIRAMFDSAANPDQLYVGICEQNSAEAKEACVPGGFKWNHRVRRLTIPAMEAKGPTYARYLCSTLYRGETYFCQIDSHTRFVKGWDAKAVACLKRCPVPSKAVLTHYPHDWDQNSATGTKDVPVLCKSKFDDNGILTFEAVSIAPSAKPKPVPFVSGGFVFAPGTMVRDVPYDPDLPHLFQGEEILYSARLWTSGYDFYTPTQNLVYHKYGREDSPKFWGEVPGFNEAQAATLAKVRKLMAGEMPAGYAHGMGKKRSIKAYWAFIDADPVAKVSKSEAKFCK
jgi:[Skp1-protein]-hydroxyproline N-acetylglucosaminyltransferase